MLPVNCNVGISLLSEKINKYAKENNIQITKLNNGEFMELEYTIK